MPNRTLKSPEDIRKKLQRHWIRNRSLWLAGCGQWPLVLTLGQPVQSAARLQTAAVLEWVRAWRDNSGVGQVEWQERQWLELGRQQLPVRWILKCPEEVALWIGESQRWSLARERFDRLVQRWPRLSTSLGKYLDVLSNYSEQDIERLARMLAWLDEHPQSGLFPRQLPIAGLDSKWLESRKGLIADLVATLRATDPSLLDFYQCCGLRPPPNLMRIAILDPDLRAHVGGLRDLTAPVEEIADLGLSPKCVFLVENIQTGLAFDDLKSAIVIMGLGYRVNVVQNLRWTEQAAALYWGDIDTHGFAILASARGCLPQLESMMMNEIVLLQQRQLCVEENEQHGAESLPSLTDEELHVYRALKQQTWGFHLRLEQERIPWPEAWSAIEAAHGRCR